MAVVNIIIVIWKITSNLSLDWLFCHQNEKKAKTAARSKWHSLGNSCRTPDSSYIGSVADIKSRDHWIEAQFINFEAFQNWVVNSGTPRAVCKVSESWDRCGKPGNGGAIRQLTEIFKSFERKTADEQSEWGRSLQLGNERGKLLVGEECHKLARGNRKKPRLSDWERWETNWTEWL